MTRPRELGFTLVLCLGCILLPAAAQTTGVTATLPNGRTITPVGGWIDTAPYPFALALRPDGKQLVVPSIGFPFALNIIDTPGGAQHTTQLPSGVVSDPSIQVHTGVAYSPDGTLLYDATGDTGAVAVLSTKDWSRVANISLNGELAGRTFGQSFSAALVLSADGALLYVLDQANWRVVIIDTATRRPVAWLETGVDPIALCLSPDGHKLYVANSGLFEYQFLSAFEAGGSTQRGLPFPPFGYPSPQAENGTVIDGGTVPGLGDENSERGSSVWTYDVTDRANAHVLAKLRLGEPIRATSKGVVGGAAPSAVAADAKQLYVALAHQDTVAIVSADGQTLLTEIPLSPFAELVDADRRPLRGVMPSGLAVAGDRLYVTEAGINAVAVVETVSNHVLGHMPVGWNPSAAAVSQDGRTLYVVNSKGKGTGPNAGTGFHGASAYIGALEHGSVSVIPTDTALSTASVLRDNGAALTRPDMLPRLQHVFLIIRENRTFDEVLGDVTGANGQPSLARYGAMGWTEGALKQVRVTPNAHALVAQFATSDNYFVDSDVSADGHRWAVGIAPTPWMNIAWTSGYGGRRNEDVGSLAPGRRALFGGADAPMPEDEPEFGSLWEHVAGAGLRLLNYGEGLEVEGSDEIDGAPTGQRLRLNAPIPQPVFESSDTAYPTFNLGIPDQVRAAEFQRDFSQRLAQGPVPALIVIRLPNDHTADPRPSDGYPYRASYVADNDLALGKIVAVISHSKIWKDSAIFVTEDDAQGGVDHVDAHRSVLLVISPYARPGYISHRHSSMGSIQKTIYELLGIGPLNLEDALAADLGDMFTRTPRLTTFSAVAADARIFDAAHARAAHPKNAAEAKALLDCDDPRTIAPQFRNKANGTKSTAHTGQR